MNLKQIDEQIAIAQSKNYNENNAVSAKDNNQQINVAITNAKISYAENTEKEQALLLKLTYLLSRKYKTNNNNEIRALINQQINTATKQIEAVRSKLIIPLPDVIKLLKSELTPVLDTKEREPAKSKYSLTQLNKARRLRFAIDQKPEVNDQHINNVFLTQKIKKNEYDLYKEMIA